ncbi:hypothetical protein RFI_00645 [Reticulomyxa filosa]|uniref:USP domain-containing protein n=1 Tax=Reticulomyxa filosa TaxID=46433 RepID=X6PD74_RETFI|nr:hypothetical protein RFI_00645 [Reticulomyxa filosa]|eukprot:ETO36420.1 hypothetical protein RFI_00645 [Reticulomyxa filosa]
MNVRVQMDVDEFFATFADKLEKQLQFDNHEKVIQYLFGGVFVNQFFGRKACHHYSGATYERNFDTCTCLLFFSLYANNRERSEPFITLTVDVRNKGDLEKSLESFVKGEIIEDYYCEVCKNKTELFKRVSVKILPRHLVIHLKRFEFDVEHFIRVLYTYTYTHIYMFVFLCVYNLCMCFIVITKKAKINDQLSFYRYLDMEPYMQQSLEKKEEKKEEKKDETDFSTTDPHEREELEKQHKQWENLYDVEGSTMYQLAGIIQHSGTCDSGHYTSIIRERLPRYAFVLLQKRDNKLVRILLFDSKIWKWNRDGYASMIT